MPVLTRSLVSHSALLFTALSSPTYSWPAQYFSYAFVAGASLLGLLLPALAPVVLAPILLVGLVGLGLAHGACDQLILPALYPAPRHPGRRMRLFLLGYLGLAVVAGLGWWCWPAGGVATFGLLTSWHWGSADATAQPGRRMTWLVHSLLRGGLFFAVPARWWAAEAQHSLNGLLVFAGSTALPGAHFQAFASGFWLLIAGGHLLLWGYYGWQRQGARAGIDAGEVGLLTTLFLVLPPVLALGSYFVFWHSLRHTLRLTSLLGYTSSSDRLPAWKALGREVWFFVRRALPMLGISLIGLVGLYFVLPPQQRASEDAWLGVALAATAALTLPHTLLVSVVLDTANWRRAA